MTIGIIGAGKAASSIAIAALVRTYGPEVQIVELPIDSTKISGVSTLCISVDEISGFNTAEAAERFRKTITACSHTPYRQEEPEEPKKQVFFHRDIVPNKKRRFGNR